MKFITCILLLVLFLNPKGYGQLGTDVIGTTNSESIAASTQSQITVTTSASVKMSPDYFSIQVKLEETTTINPNTQIPIKTTIEELERTLLEVLKRFNIVKKDLTLVNLSESTTGNTAYGTNGNAYTVTQKKQFRKEFEFKWEKDVSTLESLIEKLRFNGFKGATITPKYSKEQEKETLKKLFLLAMGSARENAKQIAQISELKLGKLSSVYHYEPISNYNYPYAGAISPYNYTNQSTTTVMVVGNQLSGITKSISLTVSYLLVN